MNLRRKFLLLFSILAAPAVWAAQFNPFVSGPYNSSISPYDVIISNEDVSDVSNGSSLVNVKNNKIEIVFFATAQTPNPSVSLEVSATVEDENGNDASQWMYGYVVTDSNGKELSGSPFTVGTSFDLSLSDFENVDYYEVSYWGLTDSSNDQGNPVTGTEFKTKASEFKIVTKCPSCTTTCSANMSGQNSCIEVDVDLGPGKTDSGITGSLKLYQDLQTNDINNPDALDYALNESFEIIYDPAISDGQYLQVFSDFENSGKNTAAPVPSALSLADAGKLEYPLSALTGGDYYLWLRTRAFDDRSESLWLTIGDTAEALPVHAEVNADWKWSLVAGPLNLAAGDNQLNFSFRESGLQIDQILLTDDAAFTPVQVGSVPPGGDYRFVEAESVTPAHPFYTVTDSIDVNLTYIDVVAEPTASEIGNSTHALIAPGMNPGVYKLWTYVSAPDSNSDSVWVNLDDSGDVVWQMQPGAGYGWQDFYQELTLGTIEDVSLELSMRESGIAFDRFLFSEQGSLESQAAGYFEFEAEVADLTGDVSAVDTGDPVSTGDASYLDASTGFTTTATTGAATYNLVVNNGHEGNYRLFVRARVEAQSPGVEIVLNASSPILWSLPQATDWSWIELSGSLLQLAAGAQTLQFDFDGSGVEIDRVILTQDVAFAPAGLELSSVFLEAESVLPQAPFTPSANPLGITIEEASLRNAAKESSNFVRMPTAGLSEGDYYLWVRAPLSLTEPDSLWFSSYDEDELWTLEHDVNTQGVQSSDQDWIWHRYPYAVDIVQDYSLRLTWRERGTRLDALFLTQDPTFNPNPVELGGLATENAVVLYQEAEESGHFTSPWVSYRAVKQVLGGNFLLDVVEQGNGYDLDLYFASSVSTKTGTLYDLPTAASERYISYRFEDPAGDGEQLTISRSNGGAYSVYLDYLWNAAAGDWSLSRAGGLSVESAESVWNENRTVETRTMTVGQDLDADGSIDIVTSKEITVFEYDNIGRRLLTRILDPDGEADTTSYTYTPEPLEGSGAAPVGFLRSRIDPNGNWQTYDYLEDGRISKRVSQYVNSTFADEQNSRVTSYNYEIPQDLLSALPNVVFYESMVTTVLGIETSRSYTFREESGNGAELTQWSIQATDAGDSWNAAGNRVSVSKRLPDYRMDETIRGYMTGSGAQVDVENLTLYDYSDELNPLDVGYEQNLALKTTTLSGIPNASDDGVVEGTKTVRWTRLYGDVVTREENYSVLTENTEELVSSWLATDIDPLNRVLETTHYDENGNFLYTMSKVYDCCGLISETDRSGITTYYTYDGLDRRLTTTRLGVTTENVYDAEGRVVATKRYPEGQPENAVTLSTSTYGLDGEMLSQSSLIAATGSPTYATTSYAHEILTGTDGAGDTVGMGERRTMTYEDGGINISETAADGSLLRQYGSATNGARMVYGSSGNLLTERQIPLVYNTGATDPLLSTNYSDTAEWTETHSEMGRSVKTLFADSSFAENFYDSRGRVEKSVDPDGIVTLFAYNAEGERYRTAIDLDQDDVIGVGAADPDRVTETEILLATRDGETVERVQTAVWTDSGLVVTSIQDRSLDGRESWSQRFEQVTHTVQSVPADGDWTITTTQPDGSYTIQTYTDGRMSGTASYDSAGVLLASNGITYDNLGRQSTITDSRTGTTTLAYYDNDALESTTAPDPDGAGSLGTLLTQYLYDVMGRQTQVIHPDATSTYTVYNQKNQLTKTYGSLQNPVEYTYDYAGRQATLTTWQDFDETTGTGLSGSAVTTWIYDSQRGWLSRKEYPDAATGSPATAGAIDYTYTPGGRLASRTWARGLATNYAYNSAGELLAADYDDAGATPDLHYSYTRTGQQDVVGEGSYAVAAFTAGQVFTPALAPSLNTTDRSTDYAYNARFQIETETMTGLLGSDVVLARSYEDGTETNGLIGRSKGYDLSVSASSVQSADYTYDAAGRLATVADGSDTFTYGYLADTVNLLASVTGPVHTATYSYEPGRNAMTGIENKETVGTATVVSNYSYTYNALGQRADREQSGTAFTATTKDTFTYDYLGQVTASSNDTESSGFYDQSFTYDEIGNRLSHRLGLVTQFYSSNALNQYDSLDYQIPAFNPGTPQSLIDDTNAIIAERPRYQTPTYDLDGNQTSDEAGSYTWNGENRLRTAGGATFTYDYMGRLVKKDDGTDVEVYVYDGWNRIAKYVNGSLSSKNLWGLDLSGTMQGAGGVGGLLKEGNLYATYDANGNIVQKLNSSGVASMAVEYDPFGNVISGILVGEYGFSTKPLVDDIEFYYYGYRYYDPETGRWPSRDPIEEQGGLNLYCMVGNDLVNHSDVLGEIKLATKISGTLASRIYVNGFWWLRHTLNPNDLYSFNDDEDEMSPYLDGQILNAISKYSETNDLSGWIYLSNLGLRAHRRTGGNFTYQRDDFFPTGTGSWLNGAAPDVYATGRVCIDESTSPNNVYVDELNMVWSDRIDPNENSDILLEQIYADLTSDSRVWFNIEVNWTIEEGALF
ncbi:MAG: RHS repeat-associated core domain-containing protein [Verrucomicrobiota bacterium]